MHPMYVLLPESWNVAKMVDEKFCLLDLLQMGLGNTLFITYSPEEGLKGLGKVLEELIVTGEHVSCHVFVSLTNEQEFQRGHLT